MVFAVWAGRPGVRDSRAGRAFPRLRPLRPGAPRGDRTPGIASRAGSPRNSRASISRATSALELGEREYRGLDLFLRYAAELTETPGMLTHAEAVDLLRSADLIGTGMAADAVRRELHPEGVATYIIDRNINYTNVCTSACAFCAFHRPLGHPEGYVISEATLFQKIQETIELGGTGILMQGGLHPELRIEWYEDLLRSIKKRFRIHLHCFSSPEILNIASVSGLSIRDTLVRLRDAGLDSIPGGGRRSRRPRPPPREPAQVLRPTQWAEVHRVAHSLGMSDHGHHDVRLRRDPRERVNHLEVVRRIQQETGGFTAFIPWTFQQENTALGRSSRRGDRGRIPEDTRGFAAVLGGRPERAGLLGDAGLKLAR